MLIDWFTVGAQALNFIILVWLLKRYLYKPILNAVDAREKKIAAELADADAKKAEAIKERDDFQHKNAQFDQQRADLLRKATDAANAEREHLLDEARKAADALSAKRQEALRSEAKSLNEAVRRKTQEEVFAIARKALIDLAGAGLEERMTAVFTDRLRHMDDKAKASFAQALKTAPAPALVRSAFELPADQRATIQKAINETFSIDAKINFETTPNIVSGMEISTNGQKIGWTIAEYLKSLEKEVDEVLKAKDRTKADAEPAVKTEAAPKAAAEPQAKAADAEPATNQP
jgi:F-type H+-transporting ATPase subunit b